MEKLVTWLTENKITEVECITPDQTGIARGKIMPTKKFIEEGGIRLPESVMMQTATGDYPEDSLYYRLLNPADIDMILKPDSNAMYRIPWAADPSAQIIHDCHYSDGRPFELSPRAVLKRVLGLYEAKGWLPIVAPEMEFYLAKRSATPDLPLEAPIGRSGRAESARQSFSLDAANEFDPFIETIYDWCEEMGLDIDTVIHEEGPAQLEFNFRHGKALHLADQVFLFKRLVREAALKHGIDATFMAKPIEGEPGSAMHVHQSLTDIGTGKNLFANADGSDSDMFRHYIGGLQKYIPELMPIFAPNVNSYRRYLADEPGNAPTNVEWGFENRTVGLRVPEAVPAARRVENRLPGSDTNPYLALAGNLIAGYLGITEQLEPRPAVNGRFEGGSTELPTNFEASMEAMSNSEKIKEALGANFVDGFIGTRNTEYEGFKRVISSWEREFLLSTV